MATKEEEKLRETAAKEEEKLCPISQGRCLGGSCVFWEKEIQVMRAGQMAPKLEEMCLFKGLFIVASSTLGIVTALFQSMARPGGGGGGSLIRPG